MTDRPYTDRDIGRRIKAMRKRRGLTQGGLADVFGISRTAVSQWERGMTLPTIETLERVAAVLRTSIEYITEGGT